MTTSAYLEKFRSGLRQVQSQQILTLLSKEKDRGAITTVEEFRSRLEELTSQLQSQTIQPTLELFLAEFTELIDSESYNFMLERIEDDLVAAFSEMNDIDEILSAHENIINNVVLVNLELAVNDLEAQIESFDFISKNKEGFDNAIFNTFRAVQGNSAVQEKQILFFDPKTGVASNNVLFKANIDTIGEKLLLNTSVSEEITAASVRQVYDFEAIGSELDVQFEDSNIDNVIDNTIGTFWIQSTMLSEPRGEAGVVTKLEIDLGGVKSINFIQLEPLALYPVEISGITAIDPNNQPILILTEKLETKSNNKLFFNTVSAKKIIVEITNRNYSLVQFTTRPSVPVPDFARIRPSIEEDLQNISADLDDIISSPLLKDALGLQNFIAEPKGYYEYLIGFDNIRLGLASFTDTSIFVSKTQKIRTFGEAALKVNEKRPIGDIDSSSIEYTKETYPLSRDDYFHGSLEYYFIKKDFSENDALLDVTYLPVLPLGVTTLRHETLVLTRTSSSGGAIPDIGFLQFYTLDDPYHTVDSPSGDIQVYRNGQLLDNADATTGPNAALETDGWVVESTLTQNVPGNPTAMRYAIKIQNPNPNNIYTVSYSPAISTTNTIPTEGSPAAFLAPEGLRLVDLTGGLKVWLGKDNIVYFKENKSGIPVNYSTVNLVVVLRRNSANLNLTPVLEDYLIATGTRDVNKFGVE